METDIASRTCPGPEWTEPPRRFHCSVNWPWQLTVLAR